MKTILLAISFLVAQQSLHAQAETPPGFLWQVDIHGSQFSLAGSIHSGKQANYPLPNAYMDAYKQADYAIFELKEDFKTTKDLIFKYAEKDRLNEEEYLDQYLSQESKDILALLFKGEEEMLERYYQYEGWLLHMTIAGIKSKLIGNDPKLAVDNYFHKLASKDQKTILGLDRIETQMSLFDFEVPLESQVQIIESALKRAESMARSEQALFDSYYSQDTEAFQEAFLAPMDLDNPQIKVMYENLFVNRNRAWVQKLIELSKTQPGNYFMLVGCGHYFGPDNVLELLRKEGYTVKQCKE